MGTPAGTFLLLLVSSGLVSSGLVSSSSSCPDPCACPRAPLLNCSSRGLSSAPRLVRDAVAELDLSHNLLERVAFARPRPNLRAVRLGHNGLVRLSLCVDRDPGPRSRSRLRVPRCESWAPGLQLLSVERNQLQQLPLGLEGSASLQVLQLSFNRISALRPADLRHLRQLKELHLHHNLISSLHPQMFQDLAQLRVLDLSFNVLTSLHPLTYLSLRNIGADVRLGGNRWRCDCSMRSLRRRMADGGSRGLQAWSLVCASPSALAGRDLLQLEEDELDCLSTENGPALHRDVTVYRGSEILLSCAPQGSVRWTPSGEASGSQPPEGLVISDIKETDTGLYVCVSEKHEVVSVFNLQISKVGGARRKTRSLPGTGRQIIPQGTPNRTGQERNQRAAQCNLALAVCLSVFITFLIAFILGVLARPYIDVLWRRVTKKKSPSATDSVSSAEQRQYDNEAFSNGEEPEYTGPRRERRVTFSTVDFREDNNVQYYDTIVVGNLEDINNDAVIECEAAERDTNRAGDSGRENSLRQSGPEDSQRDPSGFTDEGRTQEIDFEHIPDPVEQRRRSSSCSGSSVSDKELNENKVTQGDHSTLESRQLAEDSVQQRADCSTPTKVEVPQLSIEGKSELSGFSREPFADWSPYTNNTNQIDPDLWQENEEQFEFSDSVRSTSARSSGVRSSFNDSKRIVLPTFDKQKTDDSSSSSSYVSEGEQTRYTVNSDQVEEVLERNLKQNANFEEQVHDEDAIRPSVQFNQDDYRYETQRPAVRSQDSSSSLSIDSDGGGYTVKKGSVPSLAVTSHGKSLNTGAPSSPAVYSSSSSSESEAEYNSYRLNEGIKMNEPETLSTNLDRQYIHQTKRPVEIITPLPASDSSTSDDSMDKTTKPRKKKGQGEVDMVGLPIKTVSNDTMKPQFSALDNVHAKPIKRPAPLPPTDSNSSVERAAKTTNHMQKQGETHMTRLPIGVSPTGGHDPDTRWPALDLQQAMRIKKRLDIKGPSPDSSSSSDSEDETTDQIKKQKQEEVSMARLPSKVSPTVSSDPQTQWPRLDLERTTRIKRRLDIKGPLPDSSSSSDSEDETTRHTERPRNVDIAASKSEESQTGSHDPDTRWPALDLKQAMRIKRRLDIKGPSPDSSSSSDSEDETTHQTEKPVKVDIAGPPIQVSQTGSHDSDTRWPALDLQQAMRIKRRLDIKGPSPPPDSSSTSGSEDETDQIKKQKQEVSMARLPSKVSPTVSSDPQTQWPRLDLERTTRIKRRLDIKGPSPPPDSSSTNDSEDETTRYTEKPVKVDIARPPVQVSQTGSHDPDTRWPTLDLKQAMRIKRRLDIKGPSPDSSSSSDSEDETTRHTERPRNVDIAASKFQESQTGSHDPDTRWPALDLQQAMRIKRRLDIKGPSPPRDSSSTSGSEDETTDQIKKQKQEEVSMARLPSKVSPTVSSDPQTQWPRLDLERTTRIKRRLDIKGPLPDSSSSSDSEDETTRHTERPMKVDIAASKFQESQTGSHDPDTRWPALDLKQAMRIKRRLDIKGPSPSPDSSSSSDSEDETTRYTEKPLKVDIARPPVQVSQTGSHDPDTRWPALDLQQAMRIKRRLDIKGPSPPPDSSSTSGSEDETDQIKKQKQEEVSMARLPSKVSPTVSSDPQTQWPRLDLERTTRIKRRLDIKGPLPDSSSSSDSEDETTRHTERPMKVDIAASKFQESQTGSHDPDTRWPALDLKQAMRIKRRLDIKGPSPSPDSSSSSDSEDETTRYTEKPLKVDIARPPVQVSQTGSHDPDTRWPALDLQQAMRIKRRLDIKGPSPDSSSSSDSEDETTHHTEKPVNVDIAGPPVRVSQTGSHDPDTRWPALDLQQAMRIKRRLDIKGPSPPPDSSSTSGSEDETTDQIKKQKQEVVSMARLPSKVSPTVSSDLQTQWPLLDLERTTRVKRRLDIKGPLPDSSSSSDSEDETTHQTEKPVKVDIAGPPVQVSQTGSHDPDTRWPALDLQQAMRIKRRLDIKGPSPDSSSSSDSEDEMLNANTELGLGVSAVSKTTENEFIRLPKIPVINTSTSPKMDHNIKLEKYTVITDEVEDKTETLEINPELQSRWATMNLGVSRFRKRLEITSQTHEPPNLPSSSPPDSPTSTTSGSGTGRLGRQGKLKTESLLTPENKPVNVSLSLGGQGDISGESVEVTERVRKYYSQPTIEGNPDTTLTFPHFRRYLDFKVNEKATPTPPLQQLPDSFSSSSENEDALIKSTGEGWRKEASQNRSSLHVAQTVNIKPDQPQNQLVQRKAELELKSQTDSVQPHLSLTNIPRIRRALDIRAQSESSPTSSSEAETKGLSVPDLSLGVPRVKRRLNVKAPLPSDTPSSWSESENDVTGSTSNRSRPASNMSGMTEDESLITYKRVIMKTSSLPSNVFSPSGYMGTESVAQEGPSFLLKKRTEQTRRITDVDVPPEIRWTGVGRQLSDLSIPSLRRHLDVGLSSPPAESELPPPGSSTSESNNTNQDKGRAEVPLMPNHLSLGARSVSPSSSRALDTLKAASEARNERRGLGALKAMSSERRKWDTIDENVATSASPRDYGLQGDTGFDYRKSGEEFKASTSRVTDLLYDIPRYRRHDIGGTEPPQGTPPPIPATPPPQSPSYEGLTWRSPQSGNKQSGNTQSGNTQSGNTEESVSSSLPFYSHFANENISEA